MLEKYKIEQPNLSNISDERKKYLNENIYDIYFKNNLIKYSNEEYLYWDKIKFKKLPECLESHEELWYIIKFFRYGTITVPITDNNLRNFTLGKPEFLDELLHILDLSLGGKFLGINFNEKERKVFLQNGITEEAISSSQLEGALTTSNVAKDMIGKGRKPITRDEKMILNNYKAMKFVNSDEFLSKKLDLGSLLELQNILTKDTLDNKDEEGRFRKDSDNIIVQNGEGTKILHVPPLEKELKNELLKLLDFANDNDNKFIHPFIKAIILHFWIGYLHPFCDGNGRTARVIFYWYLLKHKYWGFSYIPISALIKETSTQYKNSYLYSEQDDHDLTYFLVYIANKTKMALDRFQKYTKNKTEKQKYIYQELNHLGFNERQNKLLAYFLENKKSYTNVSIHTNYYGIVRNTSQKDLDFLFKKGLLEKKRQGTYINYFPIENLEKIIKKT